MNKQYARLRAIAPKKEAPIGGLGDKRFVYVKYEDHTLDGFRARMDKYRALAQPSKGAQ